MRLWRNILGLAALSMAFGFQPAFAIPPPPADSSLNQAREAVVKLEPILGDWKFTQSYIDFDGRRTTNHIELKAVRVDYTVCVYVTFNDTLIESYIIEYDSYRKSYRMFLGGVEYMRPAPAYDAVDLNVAQDGISWTVPTLVDGKEDPAQASVYSIKTSGGRLIESKDVPSWPSPERLKTVYSFDRQ